MFSSPVYLSAWFSIISPCIAQTAYTKDPTSDPNLLQFKSRPDLYPPRLFVNQSDDGVDPGYIFLAPYQSYQNTAAIYDTNGTLIWYGFDATGSGNVHDFKVCSFNGSDHLCFFQGQQYLGFSRGQGLIMNDRLKTVKAVTASNAKSALDQHEFRLVGDSALATIYQPIPWDLSAYNITNAEGWIQDGVFQDVDLNTGEVLFEWSAIEHVALSESYVLPNQSDVAGTGFSAVSPWDYFHINSVDKDDNGDYLISARHVSTLYKINGQTGEVIWRCGGKLSDFQIHDGFNWSYQHDARWISQNASTDIISFFDNASNGFNRSSQHSAGYLIKLNHTANPATVELLQSFPAPDDIPISASQGNIQILNKANWASSNAFVTWGSQPYVTEHDSSGSIIYRANIAADGKMNYRGYKFNVTLNPVDSPALYMYAKDNLSDTTYFMSWNGATETRRWRIYGRSACDSDWTLIDEVAKTDFESSYTARGFQSFGMVEAVAGNGTGLRNSTNRGVAPFVPGSGLGQDCTSDGCPVATQYGMNLGQQQMVETQAACTASHTVTHNTDRSRATATSGARRLEWNGTLVVCFGVFSTLLIGVLL